VNATQATKTLKVAYTKRQPVMLWGPPGVGKSAIVKQVAKEMEVGMSDMRLIYFEPVDLRGLPSVLDGETVWLKPAFLPKDGNGVLFLDELPAAPKSVQAAAYQLTLDRAIGEYQLPDGWSVVAAGNGTGDRAVSNPMPSPLVSRFLHIHLEASAEDWVGWAISNGIAPEIIAFVRVRPDLIYDFNPKNWAQNAPYACPRSWDALSRFITGEDGTVDVIDLPVFSGFIGEAAGAEFFGFLKTCQDVPAVDEILANPNTAKLPKTPAGNYAVIAGLAKRATVENFDKVVCYLERLDKEFEVCGFRDACRANKELVKTPTYSKWVVKNVNVLS
jgi:hypothetical protein